MNPLVRLTERWRNFPVALTAGFVALLLIAGFAVIVQSEAVYHGQKVQETRVQADILAASVVAALDFDADLYGEHLRVRFLQKLRDEEKYDGLPALQAAIARDARQAKDYFRKHGGLQGHAEPA